GTAVWAVPNLAALPCQCSRPRVSYRSTCIPGQPAGPSDSAWTGYSGAGTSISVCTGCICPGRRSHAFLVVPCAEVEVPSGGHGRDSDHIHRWMDPGHLTTLVAFTRSLSAIC